LFCTSGWTASWWLAKDNRVQVEWKPARKNVRAWAATSSVLSSAETSGKFQAPSIKTSKLRLHPSSKKGVADMPLASFRHASPSILLDRYRPSGETCYFNSHDGKVFYSHTVKLEAASPVERVVTVCQATRCHIPESRSLHSHRPVNFKWPRCVCVLVCLGYKWATMFLGDINTGTKRPCMYYMYCIVYIYTHIHMCVCVCVCVCVCGKVVKDKM
jgi:hypothetical protein